MSDRITARDVENQEFARKMRGYDPDEVRMFLRTVAEHIEKLILENGEFREEIGQLRVRLEDFRDRERNLQETLLTAQKMSDELKGRSEKEAEVLVKEARLKAERILEQAQDELQHIEDETGRLRLERDAFENRLRSAIREHLSLHALMFGDSLLFSSLKQLFVKPGQFFPPMSEIYHYPFLCVGWFGLFITSMNMIPVGQAWMAGISHLQCSVRRRITRHFSDSCFINVFFWNHRCC